ncbi:entericidin A/B family lipoprotein [Stenoxybacter acetivorans]|nr:entericidin A/B family lipoprotein [Stenoxybacter acetivorans]
MKKLLFVFVASAALLTACNTVSGIGQDLKAGGQAMSNTAEEVKAKMQ